MSNKCFILLTIDVEDWFQVENFKPWIPFSSWSSHELRVEKNTLLLLDLLDSQQSAVSSQQSTSTNSTNLTNLTNPTNPNNPTNPSYSLRRRRIEHCQFHPRLPPACHRHAGRATTMPVHIAMAGRSPGTGGQEETDKTIKSNRSRKSCLTKNSPKATFFVLGWIAERLPHLVREIHTRGHEVASHGYYHNLCNKCSSKDLRADLIKSKKVLEDIIGAPVVGYRAPSFSIDKDILKIIKDCGYLYDSSYNSFSMHGRYGRVDLSQNGTRGIALQISKTQHPTSSHYQSSIVNHQSSILYELPISNLKLGNRIFPLGGGGYFRLIPFSLFKKGVQSILKKENACLFYMHPWEIDPDQPKVNEASKFYKFRHYVNLSKTHSKLSNFLESFNQCHFVTCCEYLAEMAE